MRLCMVRDFGIFKWSLRKLKRHGSQCSKNFDSIIEVACQYALIAKRLIFLHFFSLAVNVTMRHPQSTVIDIIKLIAHLNIEPLFFGNESSFLWHHWKAGIAIVKGKTLARNNQR